MKLTTRTSEPIERDKTYALFDHAVKVLYIDPSRDNSLLCYFWKAHGWDDVEWVAPEEVIESCPNPEGK